MPANSRLWFNSGFKGLTGKLIPTFRINVLCPYTRVKLFKKRVLGLLDTSNTFSKRQWLFSYGHNITPQQHCENLQTLNLLTSPSRLFYQTNSLSPHNPLDPSQLQPISLPLCTDLTVPVISQALTRNNQLWIFNVRVMTSLQLQWHTKMAVFTMPIHMFRHYSNDYICRQHLLLYSYYEADTRPDRTVKCRSTCREFLREQQLNIWWLYSTAAPHYSVTVSGINRCNLHVDNKCINFF